MKPKLRGAANKRPYLKRALKGLPPQRNVAIQGNHRTRGGCFVSYMTQPSMTASPPISPKHLCHSAKSATLQKGQQLCPFFVARRSRLFWPLTTGPRQLAGAFVLLRVGKEAMVLRGEKRNTPARKTRKLE